MNLTIDSTPLTHVIACPCGWREVTTDRSRAWKLAAAHLKRTHGDPYAARRAVQTAKRAEQRLKSRT